MPIYEYECNDCKKVTEELQSMSEPALTECGACGGRIERLIGMASIGLCETSMLRAAHGSVEQFNVKNAHDRNDVYAAEAKKAGISMAGKWYNPSLALYVGDPMAWVGSIDDQKQVCKQRGWNWSIKDGDFIVHIPADLSKNPSEQVKVCS